MVTMDQMSNVMNGMAKIMGSAKNKINIEQFQNNMKTYSTEKERMQIMNEMIQDSMEMGDDEIDDSEVDNMIHNFETDIKNKQQKKFEMEEQEDEPV